MSREAMFSHRGEGRLDLRISDAGGRRDLLRISRRMIFSSRSRSILAANTLLTLPTRALTGRRVI